MYHRRPAVEYIEITCLSADLPAGCRENRRGLPARFPCRQYQKKTFSRRLLDLSRSCVLCTCLGRVREVIYYASKGWSLHSVHCKGNATTSVSHLRLICASGLPTASPAACRGECGPRSTPEPSIAVPQRREDRGPHLLGRSLARGGHPVREDRR